MNKTLSLAFALCFLGCWQTSMAQMPGAATAMHGAMSTTVKGKVVDATGNGIGGASIYILGNSKGKDGQNIQKLLKNTSASSNGDFSIEGISMSSPVLVKISMVGYLEKDTTLSFTKDDFSALAKNVGTVVLASSPKDQMDAVVVTASKSSPAVKMEIDKKVFNVENNIATTGGTALDVLKNVPSVNVDIDGNVTMRNASPQIYVDGRPTTMTVDQIPADAIKSIEVIVNPSAKYDASGGTAGILNIVLKKNKQVGYNGSINAGMDRFWGKNLGANLALRQGKFNFTFNGMYNQHKGKTTGNVDRNNTLDDDYIANIKQNSINRDAGGFMFGRLGIDYFMNDNNTFTISGTRMHGSMKPYGFMDMYTDTLYNGSSVMTHPDFSRRNNEQNNSFNGYGASLSYKHLFNNPGQEWTADANYFGGKMNSNSLYTTNSYGGMDLSSALLGTSLQQVAMNAKMSHTTLQTDYTMPVGENGKFESGLRAQLNTSDNYNVNKTAYTADLADLETKYITDYTSNAQTYAAYATFTDKVGKKFGYQVGLRAEKYHYSGNLRSTNQKFGRTFPLNLFPTIYLTEDLTKSDQLQLTYTRRVNRPSFFQLMPFTDYSDSLNIQRGNPDLVPEYTNKLEFAYNKTFDKNNIFMASVYYSHTNHLLTRFIDSATNQLSGKLDYINTWVNASSSENYGVEFTTTNKVTKWWNLNGNINIYKSKINTSNISSEYSGTNMWSWYGKLNNYFDLTPTWQFQASANYQSKSNIPISTGQQMGPPGTGVQSSSQGYTKAYWSTQFALKKTFLKSKALSATLSVSDLFRTSTVNQFSQGIGFNQYYSRLHNPQLVRLVVAYKFGKFDSNLFKRKSSHSDNGGGMDMMGS